MNHSFVAACLHFVTENFRFHELRDTAATRIADTGADAFTIAETWHRTGSLGRPGRNGKGASDGGVAPPRVFGADPGLKAVRIIGKDFDMTIARKPQ